MWKILLVLIHKDQQDLVVWQVTASMLENDLRQALLSFSYIFYEAENQEFHVLSELFFSQKELLLKLKVLFC